MTWASSDPPSKFWIIPLNTSVFWSLFSCWLSSDCDSCCRAVLVFAHRCSGLFLQEQWGALKKKSWDSFSFHYVFFINTLKWSWTTYNGFPPQLQTYHAATSLLTDLKLSASVHASSLCLQWLVMMLLHVHMAGYGKPFGHGTDISDINSSSALLLLKFRLDFWSKKFH